jgi:hypothetical protein
MMTRMIRRKAIRKLMPNTSHSVVKMDMAHKAIHGASHKGHKMRRGKKLF